MNIEGRTIARSFWGQSWCSNLERYSDFESRLPRGRSYVRNGSVVDLQIAKGEVTAIVSGSELYQIKIAVAPVAAKRWRAICRDCAGAIDSLVELLQGRLAKAVMDRVCREGDGLFPAPSEIELSCSCPDWADMCKHVAAALYGVGARLDEKPQLLFVLRGVDENELLASAGADLTLKKAAPGAAKVLDDRDVAALFGLEMAETANSESPTPTTLERQQRCKSRKGSKTPAVKRADAARKSNRPRTARTKSEPELAALASVQKGREQRRRPPRRP
ncbi:MAG: SWIM zinc finger family protein [Xanthobacteraceae bacterium]